MDAKLSDDELIIYCFQQDGEVLAVSMYDEEGVEGWRWTYGDFEWYTVGSWDEKPVLPEELAEVLRKDCPWEPTAGGVWPTTSGGDWCGEFKAKDTEMCACRGDRQAARPHAGLRADESDDSWYCMKCGKKILNPTFLEDTAGGRMKVIGRAIIFCAVFSLGAIWVAVLTTTR